MSEQINQSESSPANEPVLVHDAKVPAQNEPVIPNAELPGTPLLFSKYDLWFAQILLIVLTSVLFGYLMFRFMFPNPKIEVLNEPGRKYEYIVDINQADWIQLMLLPEVGEKLAKKIVAYREEHGPFPSVEELSKVNGIGKITLQKLLPHIKCTPPKQ